MALTHIIVRMVIVPIPTASQLAMVSVKLTEINKKGRRRFTRITLTDSGLRAGKCPLFPSLPAPTGEGGCGHPESPRRGCWGAGPEQGLKPEGQNPPRELTPPQPGRRSHPGPGPEPGTGHSPRVAPSWGASSSPPPGAARPGGLEGGKKREARGLRALLRGDY